MFTSITNNEYYIAAVNDAFTRPGSLKTSFDPYAVYDLKILAFLHDAATSNQLERLENAACIQAYASVFQFSPSNTLLVTIDGNSTASADYSGLYYAAYESFEVIRPNRDSCSAVLASSGWVCPGDQCTNDCTNKYRDLVSDASSWSPLNASRPVSYCLSQKIPEHCKLHFSLDLITVVIVFNILKALLMCYAVFGISEEPLMTLGDGISSFLRTPDTSTLGCCLFTKKDFNNTGLVWQPIARQWHCTNMRWFRSGSYLRWLTCNMLLVCLDRPILIVRYNADFLQVSRSSWYLYRTARVWSQPIPWSKGFSNIMEPWLWICQPSDYYQLGHFNNRSRWIGYELIGCQCLPTIALAYLFLLQWFIYLYACR